MSALEQLEKPYTFPENIRTFLYMTIHTFPLNSRPLIILQIQGAINITLELNSLSKSHNMAEWSIGMVVGKKNLFKKN